MSTVKSPRKSPASSPAAAATPLIPPRIGAAWPGQGGEYAGVVRGEEGQPDYYLIIGPAYEGMLTWKAATEWAAGLKQNLFTDFTLPNRRDGGVAYANARELFGPDWFWLAEQYASTPNLAWLQGFSNGFQGGWGKDRKGRARAVRRVPI